jgi:hypothetical protein
MKIAPREYIGVGFQYWVITSFARGPRGPEGWRERFGFHRTSPLDHSCNYSSVTILLYYRREKKDGSHETSY